MYRGTFVFAAVLAAGCAATGGGGSSPARDAPPAAPPVVGTTWHWVLTIDPERPWLPEDPTRYTLTLGADGRAAVRADCNRGTGAYRLQDGSLELGTLATTRAMCPPGSLDDRYLRQLGGIRRHAVVAGLLRADLYADSGSQWFAAEPEARTRWYACEDGRSAWAVYTPGRARVGTGPDVYDLATTPAASGARYAAGSVTWHTRGEEAFLERAGGRVLAGCRVAPPR